MTIKEMLKVRATIKRKKPEFINTNTKKIKKLSRRGWRKPKGLHNKMRHGFKGNRRCVEPGWGSPAEVKGLSRSGLQMIIVCTVADVSKLDAAKQGAIISGTVGTKKRLEIIAAAEKAKVTVLNFKDAAKYAEATMAKRKEVKDAKDKKVADKAKKAAESKKSSKKTLDQKVESKDKDMTEKSADEEDEKLKEKKELDRALIKENM